MNPRPLACHARSGGQAVTGMPQKTLPLVTFQPLTGQCRHTCLCSSVSDLCPVVGRVWVTRFALISRGPSSSPSTQDTVLRATPNLRAIVLIPRPSALYSRRISAQSFTSNNLQSSSAVSSQDRTSSTTSSGPDQEWGQNSGDDKGSVFTRWRQQEATISRQSAGSRKQEAEFLPIAYCLLPLISRKQPPVGISSR